MVVDDLTYDSFKGFRAKILDYIDDVHVIDFPSDYNNLQRSRLLKVSLREIIKGQFLFIDTDTVIVDSLKSIDDCKLELAAVPDTHIDEKHTHVFFPLIINHLKRAGCTTDKAYYNSGVVFAKDTDNVHLFYHRWKENYYILLRKEGLSIDQPSLALTNIQMNYLMKTLPDAYNCQIQRGYVQNTKILHYFNGKYDDKAYGGIISFIHRALEDIKNEQKLPDYIYKFIENPLGYIPILAYIPLIDWYESPGMMALHRLKHNDNRIARLQYRAISHMICGVERINFIIHTIKNTILHRK